MKERTIDNKGQTLSSEMTKAHRGGNLVGWEGGGEEGQGVLGDGEEVGRGSGRGGGGGEGGVTGCGSWPH